MNIYRRLIYEEDVETDERFRRKRVLDLARKGGILRPRDLQTKGMPKDYLWRLHKQEKLKKWDAACTRCRVLPE